jgi:capsular polysaccharide transport system permease protein
VPRSPLGVTLSVWKALFLHEAASRLFAERAGWFWLLLDPVFHIVFLMAMFSIFRVRHIGGMEFAVWIMVGLLGYLMFQHASSRSMRAISANRAMFVYRQILPVDTVLVRAALEAVLLVVVAILLSAGSALIGLHVVPVDPLLTLDCMISLWLIGLGLGASAGILIELVPESSEILGMIMAPLYIASGVIFPLSGLPATYREWLMLNPLVHGIDALRTSFSPFYHPVPGLDMNYLHGWALGLVVLGLSLQVVFARRMLTE